MHPCLLLGAVQGGLIHLLDRGELVQGDGEGIDAVIDEGGGGVEVALGHHVMHPVHHALHNAVHHILHLRIV